MLLLTIITATALLNNNRIEIFVTPLAFISSCFFQMTDPPSSTIRENTEQITKNQKNTVFYLKNTKVSEPPYIREANTKLDALISELDRYRSTNKIKMDFISEIKKILSAVKKNPNNLKSIAELIEDVKQKAIQEIESSRYFSYRLFSNGENRLFQAHLSASKCQSLYTKSLILGEKLDEFNHSLLTHTPNNT